MNFYSARERLGGKRSVKLQNNTYLEQIDDRTIVVRLHETDVVIFTPHYVELQSGGWHTVTTANRISEYSPVRVGGSKGGWAVWLINPETPEKTWPDWDRECVYFDGIRIHPSGTRLMKTQPNMPENFTPAITRSGWTGQTRQESAATRAAHYAALTGRVVVSSPDAFGKVRYMKQSDIRACPFVIIDPAHYRPDGSCKCNDPAEQERMIREWDYTREDFERVFDA
jgi:hypothetical protein